MNEMLNIFCENLHASLKKRCKGHIWVSIDDDNLYVQINKKDVNFTYRLSNMTDSIVGGLTCEDTTNMIIGQYRKVLNNIFFEDGGNGNEFSRFNKGGWKENHRQQRGNSYGFRRNWVFNSDSLDRETDTESAN